MSRETVAEAQLAKVFVAMFRTWSAERQIAFLRAVLGGTHYKAKYRAQGKCSDCGAQAVPGKSRCKRHAEKHRARARKQK